MLLKIFLLFMLCVSSSCYSATRVSDELRMGYALKFHQAFILQSLGKTRKAYYCFKNAFQMASEAGESAFKLQVMDDLFQWYRKYGYSLQILYDPSGCINEHRSLDACRVFIPKISSPLAKLPDYTSEWGNSPDQAGKIREFMMGVGETISGIFCISVSSGLFYGAGVTLTADGIRRMALTLNEVWVEHEKSIIEFKCWEQKAKLASEQSQFNE